MFIRKTNDLIKKHVRNNLISYILLICVLIAGVSAGAYIVNALSESQIEELINYFNGFIEFLKTQDINNTAIFYQSLINNLKILLAIWFLGATVIGIPLIFLIVGVKGFIIGFSIGFLINCMNIKGIILSSVSVLPKELIMIPCMLGLAVSGINFSSLIIKGRSRRNYFKEDLKGDFIAYNMTTLIFLVLGVFGVIGEAYAGPFLIKNIVSFLLR